MRAGRDVVSRDVGRLEAYGTGGQLLAFDETAPLAAGRFETLSITRPTSDIAYTLAYTSAGSFGRLDALTFEGGRGVVPSPWGGPPVFSVARAGAGVALFVATAPVPSPSVLRGRPCLYPLSR